MTQTLPTIGHVVSRLDVAGADQLAAEVARALADRFRFVFLSLGPTGTLGQKLIGDQHKVIQLNHRKANPLTPARLRKTIRRYNIQLLHAHQQSPLLLTALARLGLPDLPIIYTDHGRPPYDHPRPLLALAFKQLLRDTDTLTAAADHVRAAMTEYENLPQHRIHLIPTGIDPDRYDHTSDDERTVARKLLGLSENDRVIIQVARFDPIKDHRSALRAFARAHDRLPDARLVLIGDGPTLDDMKQTAWDQGIYDHTTFLGQRTDVDALLPGADVFLLTSLAEGISPTLLEAMATRLPVVATAVGGNTEVVAHGSTGLLSPPTDINALAHNLTLLLSDPDLRTRMGTAARNRVQQHFTRQATLTAYASLYQQHLNA